MSCNGRKFNLSSPQKYRDDGHLSPNRLATPTSAHLDRHNFCSCSDVSPPSISLKDGDKSDNSNKSNYSKDIIISSSIAKARSPVKSPRRDKVGDHFNFSPSKQMKNRSNKDVDTSPQKEAIRDKIALLSPIKIPEAGKILEKSNSMDERRPQRNLRTTRSLSPRPPMHHQHAITVSDENDKVSVKLSPNNDLDDVFNKHKFKRDTNVKVAKDLAYSLASDDIRQDHMIYVPSDPWQHKNDIGKKSPRRSRKQMVSKTIDDPWELRSERKQVTRQSRSLGGAATVSASIDPTLTIPDAKNRRSRPKLQHTRSPNSTDDQFLHQKYKSVSTLRVEATHPIIKGASTHNIPINFSNYNDDPAIALNSGPQSLGSPERRKLLSLSPTLGYHSLTDFEIQNIKKYKKASSLSVSNQLLQPRHSFSTSPGAHDDELQLNIRRLSEQMRYSYSGENTCGENFIRNNDVIGTESIKGQQNNGTNSKKPHVSTDALLETRC